MSTQTPTTEQTRDAWDAIAAGFDRFVTPRSIEFGERVVRRLGLRPGMRFLDVAAGSGALSIPAARRGARVVAIDIAPAMVERLAARARDEGLPELQAFVMDGEALTLDEDAFDACASQNGVSLFADLDAGLREMTRVTKPGGRVAISAFGPLPRAEFVAFFMAAVQAAAPGAAPIPSDPPPLPFQVADPAVLRDRLVDAGLADVRVETVTWDMRFRSASHYWDVLISSNPIGARIAAGLSEDQRAAVRKVLDGMLRERSGGAPGAVLHSAMNIGIGTK